MVYIITTTKAAGYMTISHLSCLQLHFYLLLFLSPQPPPTVKKKFLTAQLSLFSPKQNYIIKREN